MVTSPNEWKILERDEKFPASLSHNIKPDVLLLIQSAAMNNKGAYFTIENEFIFHTYFLFNNECIRSLNECIRSLKQNLMRIQKKKL